MPIQYRGHDGNLPAFGGADKWRTATSFVSECLRGRISRKNSRPDAKIAADWFEETLAAQTIRKAAQSSRANYFESRFLGKSPQHGSQKLTSLPRHQTKDCQIFRLMHDLQLPTKEETA